MKLDVLENLFGSRARVRIIRLFLLNPNALFDTKEIGRRAKVNSAAVRKEINLLGKIGFAKQAKERIEEVIKLKNGKIKNRKKNVQGLKLNPLFSFLRPMRNLFVDTNLVNGEAIVKKINSAGRIKLIILSGIFIQDENSKVDLLIVGDSFRRGAVEKILREIEASIGKELVYAIFSTNEFMYRLGMYDRFVRDVLDHSHEKAINKLNI